jgi:hypothetical protein
VECGHVRLRATTQPCSDPVADFTRGAASEGQHQDLGSGDTGNSGGDGLDDRGGLARTRPGQHEQGAAAVVHHRLLVHIKDGRGRRRRNRKVEPPFHGPMDSRWL